MFRVIYHWKVQPDNFHAFKDTWRMVTNNIHQTVPGALGSFMMQEFEDESQVITIAKWDSHASWKAFWGSADPQQMKQMRNLGERISVKTYNEIEDHTR